jgi:hypothetical protein
MAFASQEAKPGQGGAGPAKVGSAKFGNPLTGIEQTKLLGFITKVNSNLLNYDGIGPEARIR